MTSASERRTVFVLASCQALFQIAAVLIATVGSLAGALLASEPSLATLPLATLTVGTAIATVPASLLMGRWGRRPGFMLGTAFGAAGGIVAAMGLYAGSFALLSLGNALVGAYQGFAQFYRFAAADAASPDFKGRAISYVLAAGVVAAIVGPNLGSLSKDWIGGTAYAGSYLAVLALSLAAMVLLAVTTIPAAAQGVVADQPARPLGVIVRQPAFLVALGGAAVGYRVMILAMTATPLAMVAHDHTVSDAAQVIQWHVLGMFVPSFVTGTLIRRFGVLTIMLAGVGLLFGHVIIALSGFGLLHFVPALVLLGVGWNFLFVGGTTLVTETYRPSEKAKVQAVNDFLVLGVVVVASFSSGALLHGRGWRGVNLAAVPFLLAAGAMIAALATRRRSGP